MLRWKGLTSLFVCALLAALFMVAVISFPSNVQAQDSETQPVSDTVSMTVVSHVMLPLVVRGKDFYTDTADSISGSGFSKRTVKFDQVLHSCVSYDMHFTDKNGAVVVVTRDDVDQVQTTNTGTTVALWYSWWKWYQSVGSGDYWRYTLFCRSTSIPNPMWPK